jgi:hypothetical protein
MIKIADMGGVGQALLHRLQQQRKWVGRGAVGHHNTDSLILKPCIRDRCSDKLIYLLGPEDLPRSAENISLSLVSHGSFSAFPAVVVIATLCPGSGTI